ncbi:glutamate-1-semialdehyde 2,1-aminomutase [Aspergillus nomiae NRRL 13137]|uniref:Glutamate-1-semialdehyde 2,1-aminomutase n=1 Tax=Aspergillus nomiae NRRL (strain ATCC 15546 / NRRL 13137 / CBS 260.88 / M93) TaxID=1509407 RepID=A0A0L1J0W9_ASPN3|nr:glutamate-1-semialdehyde 2,1-aminomutase [Aspergillus nomiae NRRL 13137]KNG85404.1 glutamate-1-semialdehyde 2,1-aminomutase [Aspergillus nomiae NRRL 13137]
MAASANASRCTLEKAQELLSCAEKTFIEQNPNSKAQHKLASEVLPGGNTRSVLHTNPFPICMERGEGNRLVDVDGHEYLDLVAEMTAGLYGHTNPIIRDTIVSTVTKIGLNLGATTTTESRFAEAIRQRIPSIEQLRFCNSGTEANLHALSIARGVTGKSKVIVFNGGYHGGVLTFPHGVAENNVDKEDWIVGKYNDVEGTRKLISENRDIAAAVLVEGMQGAGGCIPGTAEFLHTIQNEARANGMVFILDEVITSRLAPGGLQSVVRSPYDGAALKPDMTTLGKWIAGGMTIGAFGGRKDLLAAYDPRPASDKPGKKVQISHSGTFNNNTLAMNVGLAALEHIYTPETCIELNNMGDWLRRLLQERCRGTKMTVTGLGAVCNIHFTSHIDKAGIASVDDLVTESNGVESILKDLFWYYAVRKGYWMTRRGMLSLILGTSKADLQGFLDVVEAFVQEHRDLLT